MKKALLILWATVATPSRFTRLANETVTNIREAIIGIANEATIKDEWIHLAPKGRFPHARGLQVFDDIAMEKMANEFNSVAGRLQRMFAGRPLYVGHPDVPEVADQFPDKKAYAWFEKLEVRTDGLWGKPKMSAPGAELIANGHYKFVSPYVDAVEIGMENGKRLLRPVQLISVGLTNNPNLPVQPLANEKDTIMERALLIAALGLAATATDGEITTSIANLRTEAGRATGLSNEKVTLQNEKTTATTALENEKTEHGKTKTQLENAITQRNKLALDLAVKDGRLVPAEREDWAAKLANSFDSNIKLLEEKKPTLKTSPIIGAGERRTTLANAQERADKVQELVRKEMKETGADYTMAYNKVRLANEGLFAQMHDSRA